MLDRNDELIDQFNQEEQKRQKLQQNKRERRKSAPHESKKLHKLLDLLNETIENRKTIDCVSKKWVLPEKPK